MERDQVEYKPLCTAGSTVRAIQSCEKIRKIKCSLFQLTLTSLLAALGHFHRTSFWQCKCHQKKVKISSHRNFQVANFQVNSAGYRRALFEFSCRKIQILRPILCRLGTGNEGWGACLAKALMLNTLKWHKNMAVNTWKTNWDSRKTRFPIMTVKLLPLKHPWNLLATWLSFFSLGSLFRFQSVLARICNKNQHNRQALSKHNSELWILKW